jgi:hypothetical protein
MEGVCNKDQISRQNILYLVSSTNIVESGVKHHKPSFEQIEVNS